MSTSAVRDTASRLFAAKDLDLDSWLTEHRSAGLSYERIAVALHTETGGLINVSYRAVARWLATLEAAA